MSDEPSTTRRTMLKRIGASLAVGGVSGLSAAADSEWTTAKTGTDSSLYDVEYTNAGAYAVRTDTLNDHSGPMDNTNNYNDVAVTGETGAANVYVAGDSGKIYYSFENGETGTWNYVTPGSGSAIQAIDFHGPRSGHAVDGNGKVFATDDGTTWNPVGLQDANVNFYGVDSDSEATVVGGGTVYSVDSTPSMFDGLAGPWTAEATPVGQNLKAVVRGPNGGPDVTVGAGGTVLEK